MYNSEDSTSKEARDKLVQFVLLMLVYGIIFIFSNSWNQRGDVRIPKSNFDKLIFFLCHLTWEIFQGTKKSVHFYKQLLQMVMSSYI